jgi:two-component system response regulator RegX3
MFKCHNALGPKILKLRHPLFLFRKPTWGKTPLSPEKQSTKCYGGPKLKTILFVDDHEVLARLSCDILEMNGYRAISAYSGLDALAKFDAGEIDLVVTDFRMDGMNGEELAKHLRARRSNVPVIIVTGYGKLDQIKDMIVLSKDNLFPDLLEKIRHILGEGEPQSDEVAHAS